MADLPKSFKGNMVNNIEYLNDRDKMTKNHIKQFGKYLLDNWSNLLFFIVCWFFGIKILFLGFINLDFTKPDEIKILYMAISGVGLLLILLPFFKRVKVGEFEIEREIEQTKNDLSEFKNETRNTISLMSNQIIAITSIRNQNQVTVYVPGYEEAKADLQQSTSHEVEKEAQEIKDEFLRNQDTTMAVLWIRVQIEYLLRKLLEKRVSINDASTRIKYMSLRPMVEVFLQRYPNYMYLQTSFIYVIDVGNAAAHAQMITALQAQETMEIGAKLVAILTDLAQKEGLG